MRNTLCEKFMWLAMKGTILKFLSTEMPDSEINVIERRFAARYRQLLMEVDDIGPITKNPLRICLTGGIIWMAAYEACKGKMDEAISPAPGGCLSDHGRCYDEVCIAYRKTAR